MDFTSGPDDHRTGLAFQSSALTKEMDYKINDMIVDICREIKQFNK